MIDRHASLGEKLYSLLTANAAAKAISVIIAFVLWVVVLGSRVVEVTKDIPIEVVAPVELVTANDIPDHISVRLSGPKAFLRAILDRREEPIRVNLAGAKPGLVTYRFFSDYIRVPIGVKVLQIIPASIPIKIEAMKRRDIPVKLETLGVLPEGYRLLRTTLKPDVVRVKGPESRIDSLTEISTVPVDISGTKGKLEKDVAIDLARYNVQLEGDLPRATIEVEPISANFRIKNVDIRVISSYKFRLEEKNVTVHVRAEPRDLKLLDRANVYAVVDLSGKVPGKYHEALRVNLPNGVGLVKIIPDHVNVTLY